MIDSRIMSEIIENIGYTVDLPVLICDVSGRVIASNRPSNIGQINLLAIEAINLRAKITVGQDMKTMGVAVPFFFEKKRIGAIVVESYACSALNYIDILSKSIELLYAEKLTLKKRIDVNSEIEQFLFEWLYQQTTYNKNMVKRGQQFGIDITHKITALVIERNQESIFSGSKIIKNLMSQHDAFIPVDQNHSIIVLKMDADFKQRFHRIIKASSNCNIGISSPEYHLNTAFDAASRSLKIGKVLFPEEHIYTYEKMRLAISISESNYRDLSSTFALLVNEGKNAQLSETVISYLQYNGDISIICSKLHIHRNSIQYRLKRIKQLCGKDISNYYDLLYLYASFVSYTMKQNEE